MQLDDISIGTSGWKFDDWAGAFYPLRVPKAKWLEYYAARFPVGEINSTYYRIPPRHSFEAINKRTPDEFRLYAKVHADVTHGRKDVRESMLQLGEALEPLTNSGKLLGLLAQFPASFRYGSSNTEYLQEIASHTQGTKLCVEFRHKSWDQPEAVDSVRESGLTLVSVDEPRLPDLLPSRLQSTSDTLYVRLHGRNAAAWYDREAGDRYDYDYAEEELSTFGRELLQFDGPVRRAVIFFNNCYHGQAPRNARWLMNWLSEQLKAPTRDG